MTHSDERMCPMDEREVWGGDADGTDPEHEALPATQADGDFSLSWRAVV